MKIITGIASTTHLDRRGTRFAKEALEGMAQQINERYIRYTKDHDPDQLLGVLFYGEVLQLTDGEFALGVVIGEYESSDDRTQYVVGAENKESNTYKKLLNIQELRISQSINAMIPDPMKPILQSELSLSESLALHLDYTRVNDAGQVYEIRQYVDKTDGLSIEVYPKDHEHQPHYHVISKQRGINARFDVKTHELISHKSGRIKTSDIKKIQAYFKHPANQQRLDGIVDKMYKSN